MSELIIRRSSNRAPTGHLRDRPPTVISCVDITDDQCTRGFTRGDAWICQEGVESTQLRVDSGEAQAYPAARFPQDGSGPVPHMDKGVDMKEANDLRDGPRTSSLTRRHLIQGAAAAGLTAPLAGVVDPSRVRAAVARQEGNGTTLILGLDASPSDLDPQSQYDYRSTIVIRNIYEGLVGLVGSATDEFEGLVAESWEANEDQSVWTFKLRPGLTFHDGSACDSAAVKASYERLLAMGRGAVNVVSRFVSDPAQMETPDPETIVFNLGVPQPLFLSAMAATYGPQIVNTK